MSLRPMNDKVIVRRDKVEETTESGIVLAGATQELPDRGTVVAVSNGRVSGDGTIVPLQLNAGDVVLFGKYSGQVIKHDGEDLLVMSEHEVLAVVE